MTPGARAGDLHAVVLAAGAASRIGVAKFALPAGPGETLLTRVVSAAIAAIDGPVHVVTGRDAKLAGDELARWRDAHPSAGDRVSIAHNPEFGRGLSTSLRAGIAQAAAGGAAGALVMLADQPGIDVARLQTLVQTFRSRSPATLAVAASWDGEQRTPVVLDGSLFAKVTQLSGDEGARRVLRSRPEAVVLVDWGHGPWTIDVDTWDDYSELTRRLGWDRHDPRP
jgi:molybdenum cofactor cytidylyltransferase